MPLVIGQGAASFSDLNLYSFATQFTAGSLVEDVDYDLSAIDMSIFYDVLGVSGYSFPAQIFNDLYIGYYGAGSDFLGAYGTDLAVDGNDLLQSGTVTLAGLGDETDSIAIAGVSIDVADILAAAATSDTADDQALITSNLGGADLFMFNGRADNTAHGLGGNDTMFGGKGNDILFGDNGNDILFGDQHNDRLTGGRGNDFLIGGRDNDILKGNGGKDTAVFGLDGITDITVTLTTKAQQNTGEGRDRLIKIENLMSGGGNDSLTGNGKANTFNAGGGDDTLTGNGGKDKFIFGFGPGTDIGADTITDFEDDIDTLVLDSDIWGGGLSRAQVVSTYASVVGSDTVFDFGSGNTVTVLGVTDTSIFIDDIIIG